MSYLNNLLESLGGFKSMHEVYSPGYSDDSLDGQEAFNRGAESFQSGPYSAARVRFPNDDMLFQESSDPNQELMTPREREDFRTQTSSEPGMFENWTPEMFEQLNLETLNAPAIGEPTQAFDAANGTKNTGMNPGMSKKGIEETGMATPNMPFTDSPLAQDIPGLSQEDLLGLVMGTVNPGRGIINATKGMRRRGTQDQTLGELGRRKDSTYPEIDADDFFTRNIKKLFDSMEGKEF